MVTSAMNGAKLGARDLQILIRDGSYRVKFSAKWPDEYGIITESPVVKRLKAKKSSCLRANWGK